MSRATAQRLSRYLRWLGPTARVGGTVSSIELSRAVGVGAAQVRRDLAAVGHVGLRGVGYDAAGLAVALRRALGIDRPWRAVLVGVGNLARALLRYRGFREQGFLIVGLFDADPAKVGQAVEGLAVEPLAAVHDRVKATGAELGVLTVPAEAAQPVADLLVAAGVRGLLNFAPAVLHIPPHVQLLGVDLVSQFEQLAYLVQTEAGRTGERAATAGRG
ncbi:MAG: redox-sensing transcriptional repressor Rex [Gemmataceae bacterium]